MNNALTSLTWVEFTCKYSVVRRHRQPSSGPGLRRCVPAEALWSSVNMFASESLPVTLVSVCVFGCRSACMCRTVIRPPPALQTRRLRCPQPLRTPPSCLPITTHSLPVKLRLADLAGLLSSVHPSPFLHR